MKIVTRNPKRSQAEERLINGLKKKVLEYQEDLEKSKAGLARIQVKGIKKAEERARSMQQIKRDYERNIAILRETMSTLKERIFRQARDAREDYHYQTRSKGPVLKIMTSSDQSVEDERTENQMLKEEMDKMRREIKEMQLALAGVQKVPNPPVIPTLPPGHTPEYPPLGPSMSFPSHQYYQGRNAYDSQASQPNQNPPPPNVPVFVAPPPATLQRSSSELLF
ncbi:uncharacterized protein [Nicotiana sylvestris]|uniref:uncharacterized protein n=1 Tax=Nicotiana sylvestris TaxID=4096 RepID=UPI00388CCA54